MGNLLCGTNIRLFNNHFSMFIFHALSEIFSSSFFVVYFSLFSILSFSLSPFLIFSHSLFVLLRFFLFFNVFIFQPFFLLSLSFFVQIKEMKCRQSASSTTRELLITTVLRRLTSNFITCLTFPSRLLVTCMYYGSSHSLCNMYIFYTR